VGPGPRLSRLGRGVAPPSGASTRHPEELPLSARRPPAAPVRGDGRRCHQALGRGSVPSALGRKGEGREHHQEHHRRPLPGSRRADRRPPARLQRRAELLALTWEDIDFAGSLITVRMSKAAAGERRVPMFGSARRVLLEQKARSRFKRPIDFVFPTAVGTAENPAAWASREFYFARRRARSSARLCACTIFAITLSPV
jgi:hypothetical protein